MKITLVNTNEECKCVGKHIPKPHKLYRVDYSDGTVYVCPTAYSNLVALEEEYAKYGGLPPGSVRKHYSEVYTQPLPPLDMRMDDGLSF